MVQLASTTFQVNLRKFAGIYFAAGGLRLLPVAERTGRSGSTLLTAIALVMWPGLASPTDDERVKAVMRGARRTLGVAPIKKSAARHAVAAQCTVPSGGDIRRLRR